MPLAAETPRISSRRATTRRECCCHSRRSGAFQRAAAPVRVGATRPMAASSETKRFLRHRRRDRRQRASTPRQRDARALLDGDVVVENKKRLTLVLGNEGRRPRLRSRVPLLKRFSVRVTPRERRRNARVRASRDAFPASLFPARDARWLLDHVGVDVDALTFDEPRPARAGFRERFSTTPRRPRRRSGGPQRRWREPLRIAVFDHRGVGRRGRPPRRREARRRRRVTRSVVPDGLVCAAGRRARWSRRSTAGALAAPAMWRSFVSPKPASRNRRASQHCASAIHRAARATAGRRLALARRT